jgi:hypothetical protein
MFETESWPCAIILRSEMDMKVCADALSAVRDELL